MTFRSEEIARALLAKGFQEEQGRHRKFVLYYQGKRTNIRTMLSHGSKDIGKDLLSAIKRQLQFDNLEQLQDFINCPMEYDDYVAHLQGKGVQF
jgi:predicted RNA binding protein YcfA (HicA-like mRNA interferase family)